MTHMPNTTSISPSKLTAITHEVPRQMPRWLTRAACAVLMAGVVATAGCSASVTKHGQQIRATDLQLIQPGMGEDEVRTALGSPATQSRAPSGGKSYYYISSTMAQQAFFKPKEIDRKVIAVYFSPVGTVDRVANYGLKDGRVFDYVSRTTPSANTNDESIVQSLFRNLGRTSIPGSNVPNVPGG